MILGRASTAIPARDSVTPSRFNRIGGSYSSTREAATAGIREEAGGGNDQKAPHLSRRPRHQGESRRSSAPAASDRFVPTQSTTRPGARQRPLPECRNCRRGSFIAFPSMIRRHEASFRLDVRCFDDRPRAAQKPAARTDVRLLGNSCSSRTRSESASRLPRISPYRIGTSRRDVCAVSGSRRLPILGSHSLEDLLSPITLLPPVMTAILPCNLHSVFSPMLTGE